MNELEETASSFMVRSCVTITMKLDAVSFRRASPENKGPILSSMSATVQKPPTQKKYRTSASRLLSPPLLLHGYPKGQRELRIR